MVQAQEQGRPPEKTSRFYAKGALQYLVSILTQTLAKQVSGSCYMYVIFYFISSVIGVLVKAPLARAVQGPQITGFSSC